MNIIIVPHNHEYIEKLKESIERKGHNVRLLKPFHYSTPFNFLKVVLLKMRGYEIIHIHWIYIFPFSFLMKIFVGFSKMLGYKMVWTIHNILPHEPTEKDVEKSRWLYENVDYRFIHYKSNLGKLKRILNVELKNIEVIFHPVFIDSYPNEINSEEAKKELKIPKDKKVLLCFGMIRKYKGMELFADALEKLGDEYIGIIAGKGVNEEVLKYLKKKEKKLNNFMLVDEYVQDDKVQVYFNACDVVVLPYTNITTSGVVLLAYAFRKPVITTNLGGMPEVVVEKETGLLIPPNDVEALTKAINKIYAMDYKKMGENAYNMARKFTWEKLAEDTIKIYREVLKK